MWAKALDSSLRCAPFGMTVGTPLLRIHRGYANVSAGGSLHPTPPGFPLGGGNDGNKELHTKFMKGSPEWGEKSEVRAHTIPSPGRRGKVRMGGLEPLLSPRARLTLSPQPGRPSAPPQPPGRLWRPRPRRRDRAPGVCRGIEPRLDLG